MGEYRDDDMGGIMGGEHGEHGHMGDMDGHGGFGPGPTDPNAPLPVEPSPTEWPPVPVN
jgi:hypothetical protein